MWCSTDIAQIGSPPVYPDPNLATSDHFQQSEQVETRKLDHVLLRNASFVSTRPRIRPAIAAVTTWLLRLGGGATY